MILKESNHVMPAFGRSGWAVRKSNTTRASRIFGTQQEAIDYGIKVSNAQKIPLYIHNTNGTVEKKILVNSISLGKRKKGI